MFALTLRSMSFWRDKTYLVERLRKMYTNIRGIVPIDAQNVRERLMGKMDNAINHELNSYRNVAREARLQVGLQTLMSCSEDAFPAINLHANLYGAVPGTNTEKNYLQKKEAKRLKGGRLGVRARLGGDGRELGPGRTSKSVLERIRESKGPGMMIGKFFYFF